MSNEANDIVDRTRLKYRVESMRLPDGPAVQRQRSTRWFVQRLDGTLLDCGLEVDGYALANETLLTWEANGQ